MVSGVDSSRPTGPQSVPQNNADMISASGVTPVELAKQQRLDDLADDDVAGDDPAQHQEGLRPARRDSEGDQGGKHGAQGRADIGHEAQSAGQQPPQDRIRHAEREKTGTDRDGKAEIGHQLQRQDAGNPARRVGDGFRCRVHVTGAEQANELIAEMVTVEQDEDDEDDDDADSQERMKQGRHEGGHALEIGPAALHPHRRRRRGTRHQGEIVGRARRPWT